MKKLLAFACVLFFSTPTYSQEITLVSKKKLPVNEEWGYVEEYYVLKSDKKKKHGSYIKLNQSYFGNALHSSGSYSNGKKDGFWQTYFGGNNNIRSKGYYKNDLPDSVWQYFYPEGDYKPLVEVSSPEGGSTLEIQNVNPIMSKSGSYRNGKQTGTWEYFNHGEQTILKIDHDTKEVLFISGQSPENHRAGYLGSEFDLYEHLYDTLAFRQLMKTIQNWSNQKPGKLIFTFNINEQGRVENVWCAEKTIDNKKIYARVMEVIESLNGYFYPKKVNGVYQPDSKKITFDLIVNKRESHSMGANEYSSSLNMNFNMKVLLE